MKAPFKIEQNGPIVRYLHVHAPAGPRAAGDNNRLLHIYLSLVQTLREGAAANIVIPFTPYVAEVVGSYQRVDLHYELIANDFFGIGVDRGFQRRGEAKNEQMIFSLPDVMSLRSFPEDSFGDNESAISIFINQASRKVDLLRFLRSTNKVRIEGFLREGEKFIHLTCGKQQGYFDAMVIYAYGDILQQITSDIDQKDLGGYL
ncbi:hypothetical protein DJ568_03110 [Mucilaginibacter hurinus]|uniref:Uncharacterized protein n=1 Tax=Mucilaginibacter hurinus TaxID=2201324 RepID=A0A367GU00_9SPHI|nr:hypothetical protein [Mucilaginibacter hurinus]RCH56859.1 hypothetical protein DJ568_03110 [Mucilaginibacter hurinus]